ncbi:hypothetical protein [Hymenobacter sp. 102]|uniref:hypothetical protein n=1 Tax=Hymenobacter sp. 102 TaxID=3403152 RepID=UPI003CF413AF
MNRMTVAPSGRLLDQDGYPVAGVVHENEYMIPAWMRADPQVVQIEQFLETKRLRGYTKGGATSDDVTVPSTVPGPAPKAQVQLQLLEVLRRLNSRLADKTDGS